MGKICNARFAVVEDSVLRHYILGKMPRFASIFICKDESLHGHNALNTLVKCDFQDAKLYELFNSGDHIVNCRTKDAKVHSIFRQSEFCFKTTAVSFSMHG